jgi:hypothetical protein
VETSAATEDGSDVRIKVMTTRNTNHIHPPDWLLTFLQQWACPPSLYEGIEGDLLEQYEVGCT